MSSRKTYVPAAIASWCLRDVQRLRGLAEAGASIDEIARALNRTAAAIRNKAGLHGISLARSLPQAPMFVRPPVDGNFVRALGGAEQSGPPLQSNAAPATGS